MIFLGSSSFGLPSLRVLREAHEVVGVVTQPDRPAGRGRRPFPTPIKRGAEEWELPIYQPERIGSERFIPIFRELKPDVFVVVAYGQFLPKRVLDIAPWGGVNVHPSLLPKYRGAAPISWALWNGETETGVSVIRIDEGEDSGPIFLQERVSIDPHETAFQLSERLARVGARLLKEVLETLPERIPCPQDESQATRAPRMERHRGQLDWTLSARTLYNRFRACVPWPGSYTYLPEGGRLRILECRPEDGRFSEEPGSVRYVRGALQVQTGEGLLNLFRLQPENRRAMSSEDFLNGRRGQLPERFCWRHEESCED